MFKIQNSFKNDYENYLVVEEIKSFLRTESVNFSYNDCRIDLINKIENYANQSTEKKEKVLNWMDCKIKEGIKDIQIKLIDIDSQGWEDIKNTNKINNILESLIGCIEYRHLSNELNTYNSELKLVKYEYSNDKNGNILSLYLCKKVHIYDRKGTTRTLIYPVFIDLYIDYEIIIGRAKSKSNMYEFMQNEFDIELAKSTNVDNEITKAIKYVCTVFNLETKKKNEVLGYFRKKYFLLLDKYAKTPAAILEKIDLSSNKIHGMVDCMLNSICNIDNRYEIDMKADITNLVEKYLSISVEDKSIFTIDKDAYPIKLSATDEEESRVQQSAAEEEPLLSKAIFFDNKKMIQKSESCDSLVFNFFKIYDNNKSFKVIFDTRSDFGLIKFPEYTSEEDIQHVLFSVVNA